MATVERDLHRSPTPSTSLLPVDGARRKLNGRCVWSDSDDDVAETSFSAAECNGDIPTAGLAASRCPFDCACLPTTSLRCESIEMTQLPVAAATPAVHRNHQFYVDTKGADADRGSSDARKQGTGSEDGSRSPTSLFATESRPAYARVAASCSLPPEVERLRRDCVTSAPSESDEHRTAGKFA